MALSEIPFRVPLIDAEPGLLSRFWARYFQSVIDVVNVSARRLALVSKTEQVASLSATALATGTLDPGVYRVSYAARITRAAGTSSSLTVSIGWTDGSVSQTESGTAMTGNTTATQQNGSLLVHVDKSTNLTYTTTYATSGAPTMQYSVYVLAEQIG